MSHVPLRTADGRGRCRTFGPCSPHDSPCSRSACAGWWRPLDSVLSTRRARPRERAWRALRALPRGPVSVGIPGRVNEHVSFDAGEGVVALAWAARTAAGGHEIYAVVSRDDGRTFSRPNRISAAGANVRVNGEQPPRVKVGAGGRTLGERARVEIVAVWVESTGAGGRLVAARSTDGGGTFGAPALVPGTDAAGNRGWVAIAPNRRWPSFTRSPLMGGRSRRGRACPPRAWRITPRAPWRQTGRSWSHGKRPVVARDVCGWRAERHTRMARGRSPRSPRLARRPASTPASPPRQPTRSWPGRAVERPRRRLPCSASPTDGKHLPDRSALIDQLRSLSRWQPACPRGCRPCG